MSFKKWIAFLTAGTLAAGAVTVGTAVTETQAEAADGAYKIMCVGDSITHGYINGDNGYRKYLCHYLQQNDISYDMVGPENGWTETATYNWNGTTITYDPQHCGYSGYAIRQYGGRSGIYETLFGSGNHIQTYDPDMVLLMIGTNDLLDARLEKTNNLDSITDSASALERLEYLVDEILANFDETDTLILGSVPYIDTDVCGSWVSSYGYLLGVDTSNSAELLAAVSGCVDTYNAGVKALASEKKSAGYNVEFCDINSVVDIKSGLYDGCHPNEAGYAEMGLLWANTISSYLGENPIQTTPGTTTTTAATTTVSVDCESSTVSTTTTTETTNSSTTTTVTIPSSEGDIHLTDVVIGETYDLSAYDGITGISVVFDSEDSNIGGKFVLGNWAATKDYSAADLVNNTLTVAVDGDYDQMTIYRWNGTAGIKEVILHFADSETTTDTTTTTEQTTTTTEETTTEKTTTTTEETTTERTTTTTVTTTTIMTTDDTQPTTTESTTTETTTTESVTTESTTTEATTTESVTTTTSTDEGRTGDVNGDGAVSLLDVVYMRKFIAGSISKEGVVLENCDMDKDGKVNIFDATRLIMYIIDAV